MCIRDRCRKKGAELFLDFDIVGYSRSGSGFRELGDSAKLPSGQNAYLHLSLIHIYFFFKQNSIINGCAFRSLKIDGEIPFAEAKTIAFPYKTAWQNMRLKDENGNEALLRLTKGKHRISPVSYTHLEIPFLPKL